MMNSAKPFSKMIAPKREYLGFPAQKYQKSFSIQVVQEDALSSVLGMKAFI